VQLRMTLVCGLACLALTYVTFAAALGAAPPDATVPNDAAVQAPSDWIRRLHNLGDVRVKIGNDGTFAATGAGYQGDWIKLWGGYDPPFEFPTRSHCLYSYIGSLWIGGVIDDDTLVSAACKPNSAERTQFRPTEPMAVSTDSSIGRQVFSCSYYDTNTAPTNPDIPPEPHLGLRIDQHSYAFASRPYDRFVIVDYVIHNITTSTIHAPRVGFFLDGDVGNEDRSGGESLPSDDLSGFLGEIGAAYTTDNNGDPQGDSVVRAPVYSRTPRTDTIWDRWSCRGAIGIAPVFFDPPAACTTFNCWATNYASINWGPTRAIPRDFVPSHDPPRSDADMYAVMGDEEIDYDQMYSAVDMSADGWRPPLFGSVGQDVANGLDTRFVLAYCFGDLAPGDSLRLVMVLAAGDSVHREPTDFARYFDPAHPEAYRNRLDFSDLIRNVQLARSAWANRFDLNRAAPATLTLTPIADGTVRCDWPAAPFRYVIGYRLYRREQGDTAWTSVAALGRNHRTYTDSGLVPGQIYEYAVSSFDLLGREGSRSRPQTVQVGLPLVTPKLKATSERTAVRLDWAFPSAGAAFSPYQVLTIYRRTESDSSLTLRTIIPVLDISPDSVRFFDERVASGHTYYYRASLTNALGLEGAMSPEVKATPMLMDRRGIVLFNTDNSGYWVDFDSVWSFYAAWADTYGFDTLDIRNVPSTMLESRLPLTLLSHYQCAILVVETQFAGLPAYVDYDRVETYFSSGGRGVLVARDHGRPSNIDGGGPTVYPEPYIGRLLGIERVLDEIYYDRIEPRSSRGPYYFAARFIGANPQDPKYPPVEGDSLEAWSAGGVQLVLAHLVPDSLLFGAGYVISVGAADSIDPGTDVIYTYESAYDTSVFQGKPVGLRRITDSSGAILFNFPLSLMKHDAAWRALTLAVADLGIDTSHVESLPPITTTAAIIRWLYHSNSGAPRPEWDLNHDGVIDVRDVVESTGHPKQER